MVALHRDEVFNASVRKASTAPVTRAGSALDRLPFNWRLVTAIAVNAALWGAVVVGARTLTG